MRGLTVALHHGAGNDHRGHDAASAEQATAPLKAIH